MRRRSFLVSLGALVAAPISVAAQQSDRPKLIGFLFVSSPSPYKKGIDLYTQEMERLGHKEGINIQYVFRFANSDIDRLPHLAHELVEMKCDVIVAGPLQAIQAAKLATRQIPIVMTTTADPVGFGLVETLSRPGQNVTGSSNYSEYLPPKQLEILREIKPRINRIAVLVNAGNPLHVVLMNSLKELNGTLGIEFIYVSVIKHEDLDNALNYIGTSGVDGVIVTPDAMLQTFAGKIVDFAFRSKMPMVHAWRSDCELGALISYGADLWQLYIQAAKFTDKILRGASPSVLPVWQPEKFEFCINMKTANAIGLSVPSFIQARATLVLE